MGKLPGARVAYLPEPAPPEVALALVEVSAIELSKIATELDLRIDVGVQGNVLVIRDPLLHLQTQQWSIQDRMQRIEQPMVRWVLKQTLYPGW